MVKKVPKIFRQVIIDALIADSILKFQTLVKKIHTPQNKTQTHSFPIFNGFGVVFLIPYLSYLFIGLQYTINEFYRPFLHLCVPIIILSCFLSIVYFSIKFQNETITGMILVGIRYGFLIGLFFSSTLLSYNFIFKAEVILKYNLINVSQGKGFALNFKIKTDRNEDVLLYIKTDDWTLLNEHNKIKLYQGALGYYFGDKRNAFSL